MELLGNGALQARITSLHDAVTSAVEQSEIYSKKVVPAFRQALHSQEQLYAQGRGSIMQVWQMLRTLNDAEREALAVWNTSTTTRIQLSLLVGEEV
jgi:outer membrane protein TolC